MRLTLAEPKYLKESITIISELVNEARFKVNKEAIELVAMDPANVAMVIFKLLASSFTEYDVKKDVEIAINLSNLKQVMRRAKPNDMLTLELDPEIKLRIQLKGDNLRTFNLPLIDFDEKEQKIPDLKFPVAIKLSSQILNDAVEDVDVVAEALKKAMVKGKATIIYDSIYRIINLLSYRIMLFFKIDKGNFHLFLLRIQSWFFKLNFSATICQISL